MDEWKGLGGGAMRAGARVREAEGRKRREGLSNNRGNVTLEKAVMARCLCVCVRARILRAHVIQCVCMCVHMCMRGGERGKESGEGGYRKPSEWKITGADVLPPPPPPPLLRAPITPISLPRCPLGGRAH